MNWTTSSIRVVFFKSYTFLPPFLTLFCPFTGKNYFNFSAKNSLCGIWGCQLILVFRTKADSFIALMWRLREFHYNVTKIALIIWIFASKWYDMGKSDLFAFYLRHFLNAFSYNVTSKFNSQAVGQHLDFWHENSNIWYFFDTLKFKNIFQFFAQKINRTFAFCQK